LVPIKKMINPQVYYYSKKIGGRETAAHGRQWSPLPRSLSLPESRDDLGHGGVDLWVLLGGGLCLLANIDIGA
jgi:hypothetical protein